MVPIAARSTRGTAPLSAYPKTVVIMAEGPAPENVRVFIAIAVPDLIKEQIKTTQDRLCTGFNRRSVRWTNPDHFHLTLRFLGRVEAGSVASLVDTLRTVCQSVRPLQLRAKGVGFFPSSRAPRVIWVGVHESEERLASFQQTVQRASLGFTSEPAEERFSGHITLGRTKRLSRNETTTLARTAERYSGTTFGEWRAHEVHVMRSQLSAVGAVHSLLAAVPLCADSD